MSHKSQPTGVTEMALLRCVSLTADNTHTHTRHGSQPFTYAYKFLGKIGTATERHGMAAAQYCGY